MFKGENIIMSEKSYLKIYIVAVLLATWIVSFALFIDANIGIKYFSLLMFIPGGLAVLFNWIQYKDKNKIYECFKSKMNMKAMLFGILYPIVFLIVCALIAEVTGIGHWTNAKIPVIRDIIVIFISVIVTLPAALGEEYGWRGYLLPKLTQEYGKTKATIIVGIVWALFHAPVVFLLGQATGMSNPLLLCVFQAIAAFTYSFPSSYCFYLSKNIVPVLFIHSVWNSINVMLLGDIYTNRKGIIEGNIISFNGEGILGAILGLILMFFFIRKFERSKQ